MDWRHLIEVSAFWGALSDLHLRIQVREGRYRHFRSEERVVLAIQSLS